MKFRNSFLTDKTMKNCKNILLIVAAISNIVPPSVFAQKLPFRFEAKAILTLTDADMAAVTFTAPSVNNAKPKDQLSILRWTNYANDLKIKSLDVENNHLEASRAVCFSADGKTGFIVSGKKLLAFDYSDISNPRLLDSIEIGRPPLNADLNKKGDMLAVLTDQADNEVSLLQWKGGKFGSAVKNSTGYAGKSKATYCAWDSSGKYLAIALEDTRQVALYYVRPFPKGIAFKQYGDAISLNNIPQLLKWTEDNRFLIVQDVNKSNSNGEISTISFDFDNGKTHKLVSSAKTGANTEGCSISPNGKYIVTANRRETNRSIDDAKLNMMASLSFLTLDTEGVLSQAGEYEFLGIYPKGVDFDAASNMVAVSVFNHFDIGGIEQSRLEFWQIEKGDKPKLKQTGFSLAVPRGTHTLKVIK